jgi:hypothetical protein
MGRPPKRSTVASCRNIVIASLTDVRSEIAVYNSNKSGGLLPLRRSCLSPLGRKHCGGLRNHLGGLSTAMLPP